LELAFLYLEGLTLKHNYVKINELHITTTHSSGFLLAPIRMTLNNLECPIHPKVRLHLT